MADEWITLRDQLRLQLRPIDRWPGQMHRTRDRSPFSATLSNTIKLLTRELGMLKAKNIVLQIAIVEDGFRLDGLPRANAKSEHPGVILAFESQHGPLSLPCDTYTSWQANLRAIAMHLENLRHASLHGVGRHGEQYRGWKALPPPPNLAGSVLGYERPFDPAVDPDDWDANRPAMSVDEAAATLSSLGGSVQSPSRIRDNADSYAAGLKRARARCHPDRNGGDRAKWDLLEEAATVLDRHHRTGGAP